ncbi:MAG: ABC transporter ATP-binding protein [Sulfuricella denitrificans]|nr:ABC transporter ATP-binding protein [Sulfuricella denitrificans]
MIRLEGIQRIFQVGDQAVHALRDIDLSIGAGEYLSIMGPSGSGKSTLLNMIGLLDRPNAGIYRLDGSDVTGLSDQEQARVRRDKIGFVFQFFHLIPRLSAAANIELPLLLAGVPADQRKTRVDQLIVDFGLTGRETHRPDQLSGGQRQRVAIARATVMKPSVILADEPTGNLDRATGQEVMSILEGLAAGGVTLLLVTHDPEIGNRASRKLRLVDGRIVADERASS